MAASDKARYYLERTVPELQELAKKEVFSEAEITAIVKKRSDFEHILNGPGSKPNDYVKYAAYETNLDALRKKRCHRLGVQSTAYSGQRTVFFILDRATQKFPGDKSLWLQYIRFCQKEKANKKLARAFTAALRLRPRDWGLWMMAAKHYAEEQGDMPTARGYLQRGLRFCADERQLYLQYAKLEMLYLAKLSARRRVLGLDAPRKTVEAGVEDDNTIALPAVTAEDFAAEDTAGLEHVNEDMLRRLAEAPVLKGAVPIAIFDSAMKQFHRSPELAEEFFDVTMQFDNIDTIGMVRQHVLQHLKTSTPDSAEYLSCTAKMSLLFVEVQSAAFPEALGAYLAAIRKGAQTLSDAQKQRLAEKVVLHLLPYLTEPDLDAGVLQVLSSTVRSNARSLGPDTGNSLVKRLRKTNREDDANVLQTLLSEQG